MGKVRGLNRKNRERGPAAHHRPTRERRYRAETAWFRGDLSGDRTGSNPAVPIEGPRSGISRSGAFAFVRPDR